jgi:uncharacterized RDD family membrane protein YckC
LPTASLARRIGALLYEVLLLVAMAIIAGFVLLPLVSPGVTTAHRLVVPPLFARVMTFGVLAGGAAAYYAWCWSDGRRTLPQKTWRLRLVDHAGGPVAWRQALLRYVAGWIGPALALTGYAALHAGGHARNALAFLLVNYCWALLDRDRQFLHDRIAGTRVVSS